MGEWVSIVVSIGTFLALLIGGGIAYGTMKNKVETCEKSNESQDEKILELATKIELQAVEERLREDRAKNEKQHEELYNSRNQHDNLFAQLGTQMTNLALIMTELKSDMKEGFKELREEIEKRGACKQ